MKDQAFKIRNLESNEEMYFSPKKEYLLLWDLRLAIMIPSAFKLRAKTRTIHTGF